jgi:hypothetical protein
MLMTPLLSTKVTELISTRTSHLLTALWLFNDRVTFAAVTKLEEDVLEEGKLLSITLSLM